ncbi:MAG: DUF389 domain-containing protein, partial [Myxococcales bacterium]
MVAASAHATPDERRVWGDGRRERIVLDTAVLSWLPARDLMTSTDPSTNRSPAVREQLAQAFAVTPEGRTEVVRGMLDGHVRQAPSYWLQLVLAMGIATLGLVLNSTGVIIGAMLIAPLMGPIVGLAMGLAIGSPLLVLRSLVRVLGSIVVVVGAAALITLALPFQAVTSEIAARTSPTVLDLLVAMFCAFSAAFTTMRPGSDTVSTAAGTSIGISLVPPLCVVGFGLGTSQAHLASGAALLFVANLCSILLFASVTFLLFSFDHVDFEAAESANLSRRSPVYRAASFVWERFGSHSSPVLRLLMPVVLVAAVYVPLRQALGEVSWEVQVRSSLHKLLSDLPLAQRAVRSQVTVDRHQVHVRLVVVAGAEQAEALQRTLETQAAAIAGVTPSVEVLAVPDQAALLEATRVRPAPLPEPPRAPDVGELRRRLDAGLARSWPAAVAGPLVTVKLDLGSPDRLTADLVHLGPPLGAAAEPLLAAALSEAVGVTLSVQDVSLTASEASAEAGQGQGWLPALGHAVEVARRHALP